MSAEFFVDWVSGYDISGFIPDGLAYSFAHQDVGWPDFAHPDEAARPIFGSPRRRSLKRFADISPFPFSEPSRAQPDVMGDT